MRKFTIIILLYSIFFSLSGYLNAQNADIDLLRRINHGAPGLKPLSRFVSDATIPVALAVPVLMGGTSLIMQDEQLFQDAVYVACASAVNLALAQGLKISINRERPYDAYPGELDQYKFMNDASFPSGHTSAAFATATALSLKYHKWYVIAPSYLWASYVGYSRMHLGVHYPSDVLAGAVLGAGSAYLTYKVNEWLWDRYDIKGWKVVRK